MSGGIVGTGGDIGNHNNGPASRDRNVGGHGDDISCIDNYDDTPRTPSTSLTFEEAIASGPANSPWDHRSGGDVGGIA